MASGTRGLFLPCPEWEMLGRQRGWETWALGLTERWAQIRPAGRRHHRTRGQLAAPFSAEALPTGKGRVSVDLTLSPIQSAAAPPPWERASEGMERAGKVPFMTCSSLGLVGSLRLKRWVGEQCLLLPSHSVVWGLTVPLLGQQLLARLATLTSLWKPFQSRDLLKEGQFRNVIFTRDEKHDHCLLSQSLSLAWERVIEEKEEENGIISLLGTQAASASS